MIIRSNCLLLLLITITVLSLQASNHVHSFSLVGNPVVHPFDSRTSRHPTNRIPNPNMNCFGRSHAFLRSYVQNSNVWRSKCYYPHKNYSSTSSLQMGLFDGNPNNDGSVWNKAISKVKNLFSSEDEKKKKNSKAEIVERRRRDEPKIGGLMNQILKDAPLPVRMMGKLVTPIISSLAESMGEQVRQVEDLMDEARGMLMRDARVVDLLGEPIEVAAAPFQQSSSSMNINGKMTTKVQASFQVEGSRSSGVATMSASGGDKANIESLTLNASGRVINVDVNASAGPYVYSTKSSSSGSDDIIDAEFVEKKYNR